jgi:hypothetical protein
VLDPLDGEHELVVMGLRLAAELAAIVRQHGANRDAEVLVERQDAVIEEVARGDGHLRRVDVGEGERARGVDEDLHVDPAHAFEVPQ